MKTKTLVTVLLVAIVLISCAPAATSVPPTETAVPTVTFTVPVPTSTPLPTPVPPTDIPATPTEAGSDLAKYLATSDNVFPMPPSAYDTNYFVCRSNLDEIIYQNYPLPDGTIVKAWLKCRDGGQIFLLPLFLENDQMSYVTMSAGVIIKNTPYENSAAAVKARVEKQIMARAGHTGVQIIIGSGSGHVFQFGDPYPAIWAASGLDEAITAFMATGDLRLLPTLPGVEGRILLGLRISGGDPFKTMTP